MIVRILNLMQLFNESQKFSKQGDASQKMDRDHFDIMPDKNIQFLLRSDSRL